MKIYNFLRKSNNREIKMRENKIFDVSDVDCSAEGCFNCDPLIWNNDSQVLSKSLESHNLWTKEKTPDKSFP